MPGVRPVKVTVPEKSLTGRSATGVAAVALEYSAIRTAGGVPPQVPLELT